MIASGAARNTASIALQKKPVLGKKDTEHYARMPKNELIDRLMVLFHEKDAWPLKEMRLRVEQPTEYLRDVLKMIAVQMRAGPNTNKWVLNEVQKRMQGDISSAAGPSGEGVKGEPGLKTDEDATGAMSDMSIHDGDDDDDDDDDADEEFSEMEEIE